MRRLSHTYPSEPFSGSLGPINGCMCVRVCMCVCVCVLMWTLDYYSHPVLMGASENDHGGCKAVSFSIQVEPAVSDAARDSYAVVRICGQRRQ